MADLSVKLFGLRLRSPVLAGAGPNVGDAATIAAAAAGGASVLLTRTLTLQPPALPEPPPAPYGRDGLFHRGQASPLPFDAWLATECPAALRTAREHGVPLIASIGSLPPEVAAMAPRLAALGVDAIEYAAHGAPREAILPALRAIKGACGLPVSVKLSAHHGEDLADLAAELEPWADAFTVMGSFGPTLLLDPERAEPAVPGEPGTGYLSGAPVHPIALRFVFEVCRRVRKPVIACGGVSKGRDAIAFLMAGATAVQVCSEAILRGPGVYGRIAGQIDDWLCRKGHTDLAAVHGAYLRRWGGGQRVVTEKQEAPQLTESLCIKCTQCGTVCFYDAIQAPPRELPAIAPEPCFQCGLCVSACPTDALTFTPRERVTLPAR